VTNLDLHIAALAVVPLAPRPLVGRLKLMKAGNKWLLKDQTIIARPRQ